MWALLRQRLAHQTPGTLVLLPQGTIYLRTCKHYSFVCVRRVSALGLMPYGLTTPLRTVVVYYLAIRLSSEYTASMNKPTTVRLAPQDKQLIERIKEMYGVHRTLPLFVLLSGW
jgi:hypothetical protein